MNTQSTHRPSRGSSSQNGSQNRRSIRVEKPRSNHNSPRTADRRRTTTPSKRYATLDDHFNVMFGNSNNAEPSTDAQVSESHRPISWHPGSNYFGGPVQNTSSDVATFSRPREQSGDSCTSHSANEPPLAFQGRPYSFAGYTAHHGTSAVESYTNSPSWIDQPNSLEADSSRPGSSLFNGQPTPWSVPDWVQMTQSVPRARSPPASPDMRPAQASTDLDMDDAKNTVGDDKELVGMGLYDPPDGYDSWFASGPRVGKGLKLEETWEPPPPEEDDEPGSDDDSNVDIEDEVDDLMESTQDSGSSDDASIEEPPAPTLTGLASTQRSQQKQSMPMNLTGQSFFFEDDEQLKNEWWYQHMRSAAAPSTTLGYGWL